MGARNGPALRGRRDGALAGAIPGGQPPHVCSVESSEATPREPVMAHFSLLRGLAARFLATSRTWALAPLLVFSLILSACGGGGGDSSAATSPTTQSCDPSSCGTVFLSLTDADGDFLGYTVDVVSLTLKKANGAVVETLPVTTRVDFAQLVDLTEFVTAAMIPNGTYVEGSIRLDYSNAEVTVEVNG